MLFQIFLLTGETALTTRVRSSRAAAADHHYPLLTGSGRPTGPDPEPPESSSIQAAGPLRPLGRITVTVGPGVTDPPAAPAPTASGPAAVPQARPRPALAPWQPTFQMTVGAQTDCEIIS